jgi:L-threonylcarbamoyladenylate synthase
MAILDTQVFKAIDYLEQGELVAIPTETVYGLAANAFNENAVANIFKVKNRPSFDPLIVHSSSLNKAVDFTQTISDETWKLAEAFCPGPITFIIKKNSKISDLVTAGHDTVGIRIPRHPLTQLLLESLNFPLAAPSANPFGFVSPTTAQHVEDQLGNKIPLILDGGPATVGVESTIVDTSEAEIKILRLGGLALEEIEETLNRKIDHIQTSSSSPKAPGMLTSHYSPGCPLILGPIKWDELEKNEPIGLLYFGGKPKVLNNIVPFGLSESSLLEEAAQNLFKGLRFFANQKVSKVYAEKLPEIGLGRAINDRLTRAATKITSA